MKAKLRGGRMDKQCKLRRYGGGVWATGYRKAHQRSDPECRLHGSTKKGSGPVRSRSPKMNPQSEEPSPVGGGTTTTPAPSSTCPFSEMTQFATRRGRILLYEPESLDKWIGRKIEKDEATTRFLDASTVEFLSHKQAKSYEAYHARRQQWSRTGDKLDKYIRIVDKYLPRVAEETCIYIYMNIYIYI